MLNYLAVDVVVEAVVVEAKDVDAVDVKLVAVSVELKIASVKNNSFVKLEQNF